MFASSYEYVGADKHVCLYVEPKDSLEHNFTDTVSVWVSLTNWGAQWEMTSEFQGFTHFHYPSQDYYKHVPLHQALTIFFLYIFKISINNVLYDDLDTQNDWE